MDAEAEFAGEEIAERTLLGHEGLILAAAHRADRRRDQDERSR